MRKLGNTINKLTRRFHRIIKLMTKALILILLFCIRPYFVEFGFCLLLNVMMKRKILGNKQFFMMMLAFAMYAINFNLNLCILLLLKSMNFLIKKVLEILLEGRFFSISNSHASVDDSKGTIQRYKSIEEKRLSITFAMIILNASKNNIVQRVTRNISYSNFLCINTTTVIRVKLLKRETLKLLIFLLCITFQVFLTDHSAENVWRKVSRI